MDEKKIWNDVATSYDQILNNFSGYQELVRCASVHLKDAHSILDLGCGTGIFSIALAKEGKSLTGIDTNREMLNIAQQKLKKDSSLDVEFIQADALQLPFEANFFDGIVSNNVLLFVTNPNHFVNEAARVIKPGGTIVITTHRPNFVNDPQCMTKLSKYFINDFTQKGIYTQFKQSLEHYAESSRSLIKNGIHHTYTSDQLSQLLLKNGFNKIVAEYDDRYIGYTCQVVASK